ncbi:hypothetical protein [Cephaloticoccus capnophilus]|nr:hypothetical protein [Cephaloticoccus capnophilus]
MKTKTPPLFALAAAALLVASPRAAVAGGEGVAAVAGLIGGMIIGSHIGSTHTHTTETVVVERTTGTASEQAAPETTTTTTTVTRNGVPGHWEERPVQTWMPARWITTYDHYGFPVRRYVPGYYQTHVERVWVSGVATVGYGPGIFEPTVVVAPAPIIVAPRPYYYNSGYYGNHYRPHYPVVRPLPARHYTPHYPVRPTAPRHYAPNYRSNHAPSYKANHVRGRVNSGSGGLRPKFH